MDTLFFIAAKVVGALIRPETWIVLCFGLIALALAFGRVRPARRLAVASVAALLAVSVLPLGDLALGPIERAHPAGPPLSRVDGIVVLGGGEDGAASAWWGQPQLGEGGDRYVGALALARRFPEAEVVFTGGSGRLRDAFAIEAPEAAVAREVFVSLGLDPGRLALEDASRNTAENARFSHDLARPQADETWVLVTSAFHMPRALRSFRAAGWEGIVPYPVDYRTRAPGDGLGWNPGRNMALLGIAAKERIGQLAYRLTGR